MVPQAQVAADERERIIAMEKQMRAERLGLVPKTRRDPQAAGGPKLEEHELQLLKRGNLDRDAKDADANRVDGLGAAPVPTHAVRTTVSCEPRSVVACTS